MTEVILPATARRARRTQCEHDAAKGHWWCRACYGRGDGQIKAGKCPDWLVAEAILVRYQAQRAAPARGRAVVGVRYWPPG